MNIDEEDRKRLAQTIAMLASLIATWDASKHETAGEHRRRIDVSLKAAGWALIALKEGKPGDALEETCNRLIDRHNASCAS